MLLCADETTMLLLNICIRLPIHQVHHRTVQQVANVNVIAFKMPFTQLGWG